MMLWLGFAAVLGFVFLGFVGSRLVGGGVDPTARAQTVEQGDPIDALKQRYVNGEIDIEEFERRAKRLYETDEEDSVREPSATTSAGADAVQTGSSVEESPRNHPARRPNRRGRGGCRR